uniref:Uncharacterized protein n=1 Tax=Octopus bimaculoides TaxID=37653 RepID=A0A0L8G1Y4_OCTBM
MYRGCMCSLSNYTVSLMFKRVAAFSLDSVYRDEIGRSFVTEIEQRNKQVLCKPYLDMMC